MILLDVNVLVYARRKDADRHEEYREWLGEALGGAEAVAVASHTLASTVRILTHRGIWREPLTLEETLAYVETVRSAPATVVVDAGTRHWGVFESLCRRAQATGNLTADAWLAALAMELGCQLITADRHFARFDGLRWRHPLS